MTLNNRRYWYACLLLGVALILVRRPGQDQDNLLFGIATVLFACNRLYCHSPLLSWASALLVWAGFRDNPCFARLLLFYSLLALPLALLALVAWMLPEPMADFRPLYRYGRRELLEAWAPTLHLFRVHLAHDTQDEVESEGLSLHLRCGPRMWQELSRALGGCEALTVARAGRVAHLLIHPTGPEQTLTEADVEFARHVEIRLAGRRLPVIEPTDLWAVTPRRYPDLWSGP